ncbi:transcriptional regulator with XRE-family HTH domain [Fontibacillus solani]|uniref:Transcriptional regulator with XRE-family HTH domain n=1 Tax=Fontibacillus solani TaxID=1572857 RepID=A0A7W3XQB3_9BACL|nr:helix-turn-helix transcriptional regulator [Fontibacillus solani]MBA9084333.1 transcriptional regulator with XRE-family HTH domain [Fontibacillus solani]
MNTINKEIGNKIKTFRKCSGMSIQQLADTLYKSKATVSKYESGDISIDVVTLYKLAEALNIQVEQLLHLEDKKSNNLLTNSIPSSFFKNSARFYTYFYDGRNNKLVRCVLDILTRTDSNSYKTMLYMNVNDYINYQICENTYWGYTEHYDTLTTIMLKNQATPLENITINILASFLESEKKVGLMSGVSFRPFMPIALKMLFSKVPLSEDQALINELKISKDDIRIMKIFNMLAFT